MNDGDEADPEATEAAAVETTGADEPDDASGATPGPPDGFVRVREALLGVGLLWLAAIAAVGTLQATIYGLTTAPAYLAVAVAAATLSGGAGYAALRAFGYV